MLRHIIVASTVIAVTFAAGCRDGGRGGPWSFTAPPSVSGDAEGDSNDGGSPADGRTIEHDSTIDTRERDDTDNGRDGTSPDTGRSCDPVAGIRRAPCPLSEVSPREECLERRPEPRRDGDQDGLTDREESMMCGGDGTDPDEADTDGDEIGDCAEREYGLNPCEPDTDGDGYTDKLELERCLDPRDSASPADSERWFAAACPDDYRPSDLEDVQIERSLENDWSYAVTSDVDAFRHIELEETVRVDSVALFGLESRSVYGGIVAFPEPVGVSSLSSLRNHVESKLAGEGTIEKTIGQRPSKSALGLDALEVAYRWRTETPRQVDDVRTRLAPRLGSFLRSDLTSVPDPATSSQQTYRVHVGMIRRPTDENDLCLEPTGREVVLFAVVPTSVAPGGSLFQQAAADVVSPTRLGGMRMGHLPVCRLFPVRCETVVSKTGKLIFALPYRPIAGTMRVRAGGQRIPLHVESGYEYRPNDGTLVVDPAAWPSSKPSKHRHFVSVKAQISKKRRQCP